jgi:hypothetical protein
MSTLPEQFRENTFVRALATALATTGLSREEYIRIARAFKKRDDRFSAYIKFFRDKGNNIVQEGDRYYDRKFGEVKNTAVPPVTTRESVIPVTGGLDIAKAFKINRARFIDQAITDAKKWCAPPWCLVGNKHSDHYWLNVFLAEPRSVTDLHVHDFLVSFQLASARKWDKQAVARRIILFSRQNIQDTAIGVEEFAVDLGKCIEKFVGHQTSAASKIAFFSKPQQDVFIWDRLAKRSARFRDAIRLNESFGSLEQVGVNYSRYHSSCAAALAEERMKPDFCAAVGEFEKYIQTVGGPMADNEYVRKSSFLERRLLDKLMFCEGKFLEEAAGS